MSDEEKDAFIVDYFRHEGIQLEPTKIEFNQGLRQTMKIILNALWGKFGQRGNMTQSKICFEPKEFYSLILDNRYEVTNMFLCPKNNGCMELLYREKENTASEPPNTNVYIACFTTCHARLKLYDLLSKLGEHVLYYDTDSVIYRHKANENLVELGKLLCVVKNYLL